MTFQLDRRSRRDEDRRPVTPTAFFAETFPQFAAANGHLAVAGLAALEAPPLTVEVEGRAWTLLRDGDALVVRAGGVGGALVVTLTTEQFSDWAQNQVTFNGLLVARALQFRGADLRAVSIWDSLWIALLDGWPVVDQGLTFLDRDGAPLDLGASFTRNDDAADVAHFLREAGFVHLRGWLDPADMAAISTEMDRAVPDYVEGDAKSWWATLRDGSRRCVRLQRFVERSPTTARVLSSPAWEQLTRTLEASDRLARKPVEGNIIEALFKPVGVVAGPSDLSFHRDCHLGRHCYVCARMTLGIAISPAGEANGQLRVIAGSHRVALPVEIAKTRPYLPVVGLATEPGDVTVHLSCTLHEATAPKSAERRVMYTEIPLAEADGRAPADTSVTALREQVNDLHRDRAPV